MSKFALEDIIGKEGENLLLNASEGTEFDKDITSKASSTEEQKKRLNAEMGLDVASKLGICEDLVNNEDLQGIRYQNGFFKSHKFSSLCVKLQKRYKIIVLKFLCSG